MERRNLIHIVPSNKWGEMQIYAFDICRHYHRNGWNVLAMTRNALAIDSHFSAEGIPMIYAPVGGYSDWESIRVLAKRLRTLPEVPTVIHVHRYRDAFTAIFARHLAKRSDVRIVSTRHAVRHGRDTLLFRWIYEKIDTHIFVSGIAYESFKKSLTSRLSKKAENIYILRYSLNCGKLNLNGQQPSGPFSFIYQGSIAKGKGLETILEAMSRIPKRKFRLRICGQGHPDYLDKLRGLAVKLNVMDSIDWKITPEISVENAMQSSAGIVPATDRESLCISSMMLMAAGKPQIACSSGGQSEFLENGKTALIVPPGNSELLAESIKTLCSEPELCKMLGENAKEDYEKLLSWSHFIKVMNNIYIR